jgi:hypothetical protein
MANGNIAIGPASAAAPGLNAQDWAIVVGIDVYPGYVNLNLAGGSNDATEMYNWLISPAPTGGGVPRDQARLIRSTDFPGPFRGPLEGRPACFELERELLMLDDRAKRNNDSGQSGFRVGRRLYLYFSGHGCAPDSSESALLTADSSPDLTGLHIPGRLWAHLFFARGYFDEIVLLMDCCRESYPAVHVRKPPLNEGVARGSTVPDGRRFYGFATKWSLLTKELKIQGAAHGVYTFALLEGLRGRAADPRTGVITAASLGIWLDKNIKAFVPPEVANGPDFPLPEWGPRLVEAEQIVLARMPPLAKSTPISIPPAWVGQGVRLWGGFPLEVFHSVLAAPAVWTVLLPAGLYQLEGPGGARLQPFSVET